MTPPVPFIHLRVHSEYSLVDGIIRVPSLIKQAMANAMPAVALTDLGNFFALIKFYKAAITAGIKPIIGVDAWVRRAPHNPTPIVLLCQDAVGYRNLTGLITRSYLEGQAHGMPVIDESWLLGHTDGLIALSGGPTGELGVALLAEQHDRAQAYLKQWQALFPDRFYLEVQRIGQPQEEAYLEAAITLAAATNTPIVATNAVCFLRADDFSAHEARVCIRDRVTLADPRRLQRHTTQQYLRTSAEMALLFSDVPEALENSVAIARRCNVRLQLSENVLPDFPVPADTTTAAYFAREAQAGLEQRLPKIIDQSAPDVAVRRQPYEDRLEREIGVITEMGFAGYFLIVADFVRWARANQVPVGPGRGSGAGSLVAYALGITDLDPLPYDLLFERFLNPERVSMPDFDIDFCTEGRDRVIDYVAERYGRHRVSQIATHGTMAAKAVVRDVGRVLGQPYGAVDRIAKLIPFEVGMTLEKALEQEAELRRLYAHEDEVRELIDLARSLEGLARNVGKHAGGVVIAPSQLTDFTALYCEKGDTSYVTQFDKDDVEAAGLVKFDFLGLRTLTVIDWAVQTINAQRAQVGEAPLDLTTLPLVDEATFALIKRSHTTAVFQLESNGMKDLIRRLQPDCFEDLIALVALFRPGPLQSGMVDDFIDRKQGRARIEYPHPSLADILKPTYGVILYQEQVMQIAQVLAGYSLGGADLLRRAMGKKDAEKMAKERDGFVNGAKANGVDPSVATHIFDLIDKFAGYGFNKSHSAAYALLSYQTAWLKAHHPDAFMAAVLSADMDKTDKLVVGIEECRRMALTLLPPCIHHSAHRFTVESAGKIRYGLGAIKGVGEGASEALVHHRDRGGLFTDLFHLCQRMGNQTPSRRALDPLIRSGAFDAFGQSRCALTEQLAHALQQADQSVNNPDARQNALFEPETAATAASLRAPTQQEWTAEIQLRYEKEALGIYFSGHPMHDLLPELATLGIGRLCDVFQEGNAAQQCAERAVIVSGLVANLRTRNANKGGRMAFVTLDDSTGRLEVRLFPELYAQHRELILEDAVLVVQGMLGWDEFNGQMRLTVERVLDVDGAYAACINAIRLQFNTAQCKAGLLPKLTEILTAHRAEGHCPIYVQYEHAKAQVMLAFNTDWRVKPSAKLLQALREAVGAEHVALRCSTPPTNMNTAPQRLRPS